jgi:hypothetical protein
MNKLLQCDTECHNVDPCATPHFIIYEKQKEPESLKSVSLRSSKLWGTILKELLKLKYTESCCPCVLTELTMVLRQVTKLVEVELCLRKPC